MIQASIIAAEEGQSPLLPATYDILWGTVCFAILLWLFGKFVLPTFKTVVAQRTEKIEGGIERARALQADAERTLEAYNAQLQDANRQAASIRSSAQSEGDQIVAAARDEATQAAAAVKARADAQLSAERASAMGALQRDVGALALDLASRIVGESLGDDQRARATVDRFLDELEASVSSGEQG